MISLPRGLRNNNPLNIRISSTPWLGKVADNTDGAFEQFTSMEFGLRAALVNIRTYIRRDRRNTIEGIVSKWAPAADGNDVRNYIAIVSRKSGVPAAYHLRYNDKDRLTKIVWAMAFVECGLNISLSRVERAWAIL